MLDQVRPPDGPFLKSEDLKDKRTGRRLRQKIVLIGAAPRVGIAIVSARTKALAFALSSRPSECGPGTADKFVLSTIILDTRAYTFP